VWSGPKVAGWIVDNLGRPAGAQRGWEYPRRLGFTPQVPARAMQGQYLGCCAGRQLPLRRPLKYRDPLLLLRVHTPHLPVGHRAAG
jgi:hypothetical protein